MAVVVTLTEDRSLRTLEGNKVRCVVDVLVTEGSTGEFDTALGKVPITAAMKKQLNLRQIDSVRGNGFFETTGADTPDLAEMVPCIWDHWNDQFVVQECAAAGANLLRWGTNGVRNLPTSPLGIQGRFEFIGH